MKLSNLIMALNVIALVGLFVMAGCSDDDTEPTPQITLTADAGVDQTVDLGEEVTLNGGASSSSDGSSFEFAWVITSAPAGSAAILSGSTTANPTFTPDEAGDYTITLTIANQTSADSDEVVITVEPVTQAIELSGTIDTDITLQDIFTDPNTPDYIVVGNINLSAIMTVDAGVVVHVNEDLQINVTSGGVIDANGTATNGVMFTSSNVAGGQYWKGILVQSSDTRNSLEFTVVSYAGNSQMAFASGTDYQANIGLDAGGYMNIQNSVVSNSLGYGLFIHDDESDLGDFANNSFSDNVTAIGLNALHVSKLDANTSFNNNADEKVEILTSTLASTETVTWPALDAGGSYYVSGNISFEGNLTIAEGAIFEMAENVQLYVAENAQFVASGSSGNEIVFTSNNISGGTKWQALAFRSSNTNNLLNFVEVSHAGNSQYPFGSGTDYKVNIGLDNGGYVSITNSTISDGDGYGILVHDNESELGDFSANNITNNQTGVGLLANHVESLDGATTFSGNTQTEVEIFGSTLASSKTSTWVDLNGNAHYRITGNITIEGNLTIDAGAYFESVEDVIFKVDGSIDANGISGGEITFTSTSGIKWDGLFISSSNANNSLEYVIVSRGGFSVMPFGSSADYQCNIGVEKNAFLSITNCTITDSDGYGVAVDQDGGGVFNESGTTYSGNVLGTVLID
ncbi:MAG: hypothetical protein ABJH05_13190 [Fulvivirga sp.]